MGGGKTEVMRLLSERLNTITFLADNENRRLLDKDPEVRKLISSSLGPSCYLDGGVADRSRIFEIISADPLSRKTLEEILHPRLELLWKPLAENIAAPIMTSSSLKFRYSLKKDSKGFLTLHF